MMAAADICWPEEFPDVGGQTFQWVYDNRPVFVQFTREKMSKASGLFGQWKKYVEDRVKAQNVAPTVAQ